MQQKNNLSNLLKMCLEFMNRCGLQESTLTTYVNAIRRYANK